MNAEEDGDNDGQVIFSPGFLLKERALRVYRIWSAHMVCDFGGSFVCSPELAILR